MKIFRKKTQPAPRQVTFLEAVAILQEVDRAIDNENWARAFQLVGITDEIAANVNDIRELFEIANVRIADLARIAKINPERHK